ncbi:hypothetical protein [Anaerotignum sp.]|uniref:hypothetical protein n=1 Tax=Anaerotignum sp. TaxID=2039241 RepID=UPI00289B1BB4|nr:hypothetical protein [Anaerotignum sp.]
MQKLTMDEWETHICIDAIEDCAIIDTSIPKDITKCRKQGYEVVQERYYEDGSICGVIFKVPRRCISFRGLQKRTVSNEQRHKARENALKNGLGKV